MMICSMLALLALTGVPQWGFQTSQSYVTDIEAMEDGTMWCATTGGLIHYDPQSGWLEPMLYPDQLPWPGAWDILFQDSLLWVAGNGGGLQLLDNGLWNVFSEYEGVPGSGQVYTLSSSGGYIWAGTDGGLARGGVDGFIQVDGDLTGGAFTAEEVTGLADLDGTLFIATDQGIYSLDLTSSIIDPSSWTYYPSTISLEIQHLLALSPDSVFGYGQGGVSMWDGSSWNILLDYTMSSDSVITGLVYGSDGLLASGRKVLRFDGSSWSVYGSGYPDASYSSCLSQALGRLWCGFGIRSPNAYDGGRGLGYLDGDTWNKLDIPSMGGSSCYQISQYDGRTYMGSHWVGLMAQYPDSGWVQFNNLTVPMPTGLRTYSSQAGPDGIWTASYHWGLTWIDDRGTYSQDDDTVVTYVADSLSGVSTEVVQVISPLLNNQVVMLASQSGSLWIAQEAYWSTPDEPSGLVCLSGDPSSGNLQWCTRTQADGLAGKNVQCIYPCGNDSLWISFASDGGCQLLVHGGDPTDKSSDSWYPGFGEAYSTSSGLTSNQVFCFSRYSDGRVLAGTGSGLCRFDGGSFAGVGNISGSVKAVEVDSRDRAWCMTNDAICMVDDNGTTSYTPSNSIYIPSSRSESEFSFRDDAEGTIYFSSLIGLWSISDGQPEHQGSSPLFYPQPFLPSQDGLRMAWEGARGPVSVSFFTLDGRYLGMVESDEWEDWTWDGSLDGEELSSGVYFVIVRTDEGTSTDKIALVR